MLGSFMSLGLKDNHTITHLDLSHNKIGNRGLRQLAKVIWLQPSAPPQLTLACQALGPNSVLTNLSLCDNQIHADGGRYLGRALKANQVCTLQIPTIHI